jgi:signal transduction histidine kinase
MIFLRSLPLTFRYLEWIYITAHFGMWFNSPDINWSATLGFYGIFFVLGWLYPSNRPYWQRFIYIVFALTVVVCVRRAGIGLALFLCFYNAKSYLLLSPKVTIIITIFTGIAWTISEYLAELDKLNSAVQVTSSFVFDPSNPLKFIFFTIFFYTASNFFVIMFTSMMVAEQKSRQRAEELSIQVETLAATLERTRIAREIHDSLGHTLTDLDIQLEVAQKLRSHNIEQSFQAVDTAKILAGQCIEDVSQALHQMRQSDFNLKSALTSLMEQVRQNSTLQIQWKFNLPQLNLYKEYQIYCIVKEAIMNVQKHACASQINFCGDLTSEGIILEIKDDGIGFNSEKIHPGFGIQGMMERVQLLGGKLDITTAWKQGTQIQVRLPYDSSFACR